MGKNKPRFVLFKASHGLSKQWLVGQDGSTGSKETNRIGV